MFFLWPHLLWALFAVPMLIAGYVVATRKRQPALRFSSLALVREALPRSARWRRHTPPLLLLLAFIALVLGMARPAADLAVTAQERTVVLAIDVSYSMSADDIAPTRLKAAQAAARRFIADLPRDVRVAIVAFAGNADIVQVPTTNRVHLERAVDELRSDYHTSVGSGILGALVALFPEQGIQGGMDIFGMGGMRDGGRELDIASILAAPSKQVEPVAAGSNRSAAIVLLTDGISTIGLDAARAAHVAADRGTRIYTVGLGTPAGGVIRDGSERNAGFDEAVLRDIANITAGEYFAAANAHELDRIYEQLSGRVVRETRQRELSAFFAAAGALLMAAALSIALSWFTRIV